MFSEYTLHSEVTFSAGVRAVVKGGGSEGSGEGGGVRAVVKGGSEGSEGDGMEGG